MSVFVSTALVNCIIAPSLFYLGTRRRELLWQLCGRELDPQPPGDRERPRGLTDTPLWGPEDGTSALSEGELILLQLPAPCHPDHLQQAGCECCIPQTSTGWLCDLHAPSENAGRFFHLTCDHYSWQQIEFKFIWVQFWGLLARTAIHHDSVSSTCWWQLSVWGIDNLFVGCNTA